MTEHELMTWTAVLITGFFIKRLFDLYQRRMDILQALKESEQHNRHTEAVLDRLVEVYRVAREDQASAGGVRTGLQTDKVQRREGQPGSAASAENGTGRMR